MRERYREHVRAAVLETAHDLIAERGWDRVRMSEIAEAVGVSRALLYKEFGDKPGLGEAVALREAARLIEGIEDVLAHRIEAPRCGGDVRRWASCLRKPRTVPCSERS